MKVSCWTLLLVLASCGGTTSLEVEPEPISANNEVFGDVPILPGMNYESGKGQIRKDGRLRVYQMRLRGSLDPEAVLNFYRKALPQFEWQTAGETPVSSTLTRMEYVKGIEKLTLDVKTESVRETLALIRIDYRGK